MYHLKFRYVFHGVKALFALKDYVLMIILVSTMDGTVKQDFELLLNCKI